MNTKYEKYPPSKLEDIHRAITHEREELQQKMAQDMGRKGYLDILPRNFDILPMEKCSLQDISKLEELHEKAFDCLWTMEKKKAKEKDGLEEYQARLKFWSFMDTLTDDERDIFFIKVKMNSLNVVQHMMVDPDFLKKVNAL